MALEAFFKLKEKKKMLLIEAIRTCLSNNLYKDISVGDIVEKAGISRGSFYNYFTDKDDAVYTVINEKLNMLIENFKGKLIKDNGDIFKSIIDLHDSLNITFSEKSNENMINNMSTYINIVNKILYSEGFMSKGKELIKFLMENVVVDDKKIDDEAIMTNIIEMLFAVLLHELVILYTSKTNTKYTDFNYKVELIKKGFLYK